MAPWRHELRWVRREVRARDGELRLDRWLRRQFPALPQSFVQTQLRRRQIRLQPPPGVAADGRARADSRLRAGCVVAVDARLFRERLLPAAAAAAAQSARAPATAEDRRRLQLLLRQVVHRDEHFLVLNKPHGLAVQDGSALTESLARYLPLMAEEVGSDDRLQDDDQDDDEQQQELKLVHRLDKETSGVLVLARSRLAAAKFSELLRTGAVRKTYEALVSPLSSARNSYARLMAFEQRELKLPVDGKAACTLVERVLPGSQRGEPPGVWLQLRPRTGRKHQLRVHCARELAAPIVGDTKYGGRPAERLYLHAKRIRFPDPFTAGRWLDVSCEMTSQKWR